MITNSSDLPSEQLLPIDAVTVFKFLLWVAIGLTVAHVACMVIWYRDLLPVDDWIYYSFFNLDEEESFGTWFSTLILFLAGLLTLFHARYAVAQKNRLHVFWWLLGIGFCVLSLDEVAGFHETVNTVIEHTHWTIFGAVLVLGVGAAFLPFMLALPARTRTLFLLAGMIYVGGAIGVEWATIWYEENEQMNTLSYNLWNALEEFMEMAGVILYIYTLLAHVTADRNGLSLEVLFSRKN
jgi:hypothetical protein